MNVRLILEILAQVAWFMAHIGAGAASAFNGYQPDLPISLISQE